MKPPRLVEIETSGAVVTSRSPTPSTSPRLARTRPNASWVEVDPRETAGRDAAGIGRSGRGVGSALLTKLLTIAREEDLSEVYLNAQTDALDFYIRHDFRAEGEVFLDAGIPHRRMRLALSSLSPGGGEW